MKKTAIAIVLLALAFPTIALSQPAPTAPAKPAYAPGLGEFMTFTQARHAKLWLAGNASNWDLADYQLDELKEGLEDAAKFVPSYKGMPVGSMIENIVMAPMTEVEQAIKARDRNKFASAFDKLTQACNACHQAASRPFIVIQRPTNSAFPNQSFSASRN
jgi:hypothetical protein